MNQAQSSATLLEQSELSWYLSKGLSVFERSTIGAILDKLELESCTSRKCRKCHGKGIVDEPFTCPDPKDPSKTIALQMGKWCPKCHGTGVEPVFLTPDEQRLVDSGDWSTSDTGGTRSSVPDETLVRFAFVSRLLSLLPSGCREVIEAAYGDEGEELSHGIKGRVWAVTPLTVAGEELLRAERSRARGVDETERVAIPERPVQCLLSMSEQKKDKAHPERKKLLADAVSQAVTMLREAESVWNLIVGGLSEKECA